MADTVSIGQSPGMEIRLSGVCLDCRDAEEMASFYGAVFGWEEIARDDDATRLGGAGWICMNAAEGGPTIAFQAEHWYEPPEWPETSDALTKMMHFEVATDDLDAAIDLVIRSGGQIASHQPSDRNPAELRVMLDPAGHPFCLGLFGT